MEDFKQKVVQGFAWEAFTRFVVQIASWISTFLVARILSPSDYGIVGISGIFTGLCLKMAGMGLGSALVSRKELEEQDLVNAFWIGGCLSIAFYLLLFVLAPYIADFYEIPELKDVIWVAGIMVVISALSIVPRAVIMRQMRFKLAAIFQMLATLIVTVSALGMAFAGWGYWALVLSTVAGELFLLLAFGAVVRFAPGAPRRLRTAMPMLRYGGNMVGASLVGYVNGQWATIYSGGFLGKEGTGYYQMAYTIAGMPMTKIGEIFEKVAFPSFARIQGDRERTKHLFLRLHRTLFMVTVPMFLGMALLARDIVILVLGVKWESIVLPLQILCVLNVFRISAQIIPPLMAGVGNARATRNYQLVLAPLMAISMLLGVQWGLNWMLLAWACSFPVAYGYLLAVLYRDLRIHLGEVLQSVYPTLASGAIMSLGVISLNELLSAGDPYIVMGIKVVVGAMLYGLAYAVFDFKHLGELYQLLLLRGKVKFR